MLFLPLKKFEASGKTISLGVLFFTLTLLCHLTFADEKSKISSNYPNDLTSYNQLNLSPRGDQVACQMGAGTIYVDNNGDLQICGLDKIPSSKIWTKDGDYVYPAKTTTNPNLTVSIGAANSDGPLTIVGKDSKGNKNRIGFNVSDPYSNNGLIFYIPITPTDATSYASFFNFHVGEKGQPFDGRIVYRNPPTGLRGMGLHPNYSSLPLIWIDRPTHNVGIGTTAPSQKLDVKGNTETKKLFLKSAGPTAELKMQYSGGGYYAVYAP